MIIFKSLILFITLLSISGSTLACNRSDMLKVYFFFFGDDTYLPIKIKDLKNKSDSFLMRKDDFSQLILNSKPAKEDWFENIRMRVKAKDGAYFFNKDGVIYFNKSIIGQLDKEILNSLDFGFGLYEAKTCSPLNVRMINLLGRSHNTQIKEYLEKVGDLADWRTNGFVGYKKEKK